MIKTAIRCVVSIIFLAIELCLPYITAGLIVGSIWLPINLVFEIGTGLAFLAKPPIGCESDRTLGRLRFFLPMETLWLSLSRSLGNE